MSKRKNEALWVESRQRWQINVQSEGVRRTFTSSTTGKKGKIEAEKKADKWLEERLVGENTKCETLLEQFCEHKKATTSKVNYDQVHYYCQNYIGPIVGKKRIGALSESDLQRVIDQAFTCSGLSKKTLTNIRATMMNFLKYCRKAKTTTLYPEDLVIPKNAKRSEKHIAQPADIKKLFSCNTTVYHQKICEDHYIHAYRFAVLTGLRPGELLGLQWNDLNGDTLSIRRAINDDGDITEGKNANAQRRLSVKGRARVELDAQRAMLLSKGIVSKWIFATPEGEWTRQKRYRKSWERYCIQNELSKVTPYELRHTYVSVNDEMPDGLKKKALGHSKNMDTEGVYGHLKDGDLDRIAAYSDASLAKIIAN